MKKIFFALLLLPSVSFAGGPKYTYQSIPGLNDEMQNIYHDIAYPIENYATISSATITNLVLGGHALKYMQFVSSVTTASKVTTSSSFVATSLSMTITPTSSTSKILVLASGTLNAPANKVIFETLFRNTTNLGGSQGLGDLSGNGSTDAPGTIFYVDSPNTTSQVMYIVEIANNDNAASVQFGNGAQNQSILLVELN